jgi:hypothetical protein
MKPLKSIKILIIFILSLSLLSGTLNKIFPSVLSFPNLTNLLSIHLNTISNFKIWQFFTHLFFYPAPHGLHIFYLINLFFGLMLLQKIGTIIAINKGEIQFILYFLFCGLISGFAAFLTILYFGLNISYAGPSSALFSLLVATVFLFPKLDLMIFFSNPVKGKNLVPSLIGIMLLMNLSTGNYVQFFATFAASLASYLYILFFWKIESPYPFMKKFDKFIIYLSKGKLFSIYDSTKLEKYTHKPRIFDIKTGKAILSEENFIGACLEKISKEGKNSLTFYEKFRLYKYSKKVKKQKNSL